jgi:hypothetical protein
VRTRPGIKPRGIGQRVSLIAAFLCYGAAVACLVALGLWVRDLGSDHPVIASLGASVVFFVGAGVVLHVMALADLPSLRFHRDDEPPRAS